MDSDRISHVRCWVEIDDDTLAALFQSRSFGRGGALRLSFDTLRFEEEFFALPVLRMWTHATINIVRGSDAVAFETYGSGTLVLRRDGARLLVHRDRPFQGRPAVGTGALVITTEQLVSALLGAHRALARQVFRVLPAHIREDHPAWRAIQDERGQLKQAWHRIRTKR
ncbi:MAG: hypothetical protein AAGF99_13445 [Bacteroidota bacterium]